MATRSGETTLKLSARCARLIGMTDPVINPGILASTRLPPERYLELIRSGSARLSEVATMTSNGGLDAGVSCCPGWKVRDVLSHVAEVYQHKIACMRDNANPDPWPLPEFEGRDPKEFFTASTEELLRELEERGPAEPSFTWWADPQSTGFWFRRMAQETAVHRYDAELAHDATTPIDPELAVDGIDEVLRLMLGGPWWAEYDTSHPVDATVRVDFGGRFWLAAVGHDSVTITDESYDGPDRPEPVAGISGDPELVLLWLWGRRGDDAVSFDGDPDVLKEFRARLAEAT